MRRQNAAMHVLWTVNTTMPKLCGNASMRVPPTQVSYFEQDSHAANSNAIAFRMRNGMRGAGGVV